MTVIVAECPSRDPSKPQLQNSVDELCLPPVLGAAKSVGSVGVVELNVA